MPPDNGVITQFGAYAYATADGTGVRRAIY